MYDLDGDEQIDSIEVKALITLMIGENNQMNAEELEKISNAVINECGKGDNLISFDEFYEAIAKIDVKHKMSIHLS